MLKVGMIGGGYFGQFHINAWMRLERTELCGVVVIEEKRREELQKLYPETSFFHSLDALREAHPALDIIDVATPPRSHTEIIQPLLGSVPVIICQKPFCANLAEARALTEASEASNTQLVTHENFRFMPWYRIFKREITKGSLGTLRQAHFRMRPGDGNGEDAYLSRQPYFRQMERFLIHETGVHWIDVFRFLFGEPQRIYAELWQTNSVIVGEDSGLLLMHWENGLRAIFDGNRTLDHVAHNHRLTMGEFTLEGEKATLMLNGDGNITLRERGSNHVLLVPYGMRDNDFGGDCVYHFQKHIVAHLLDGQPIETDARSYLRNLEIEEAVYRSAETGQALKI